MDAKQLAALESRLASLEDDVRRLWKRLAKVNSDNYLLRARIAPLEAAVAILRRREEGAGE